MQSGDGGLPAHGSMALRIGAVVDMGRPIAAQGVKQPHVILPVEVPHVVPKRPLQLALGLWVCHRRMEQSHRQVCAKGREEFAREGRAIVEHHRLGDHALLAHGGNEHADGGTDMIIEEHITEVIASGIVSVS
jgi:hypothetical protein